MSKYTEAIECHCKGLAAVSTGVCGGCQECMSSLSWKLERRHFNVEGNADSVALVIDSEVVIELTRKQVLEYETDEEDALWEEYLYSFPDVPEAALNKAFSADISNGLVTSEGYFSRCQCDTCGSYLAGMRYDGHAVIVDNNQLIHLSMCGDCLLFFANGDEPTLSQKG
jgi:hypothetical protein